MNKKIVFIDAFSTIHVGNGALLDNSFKIASQKFKTDNISIITSDPETNKGRYNKIIEDVFSNYPSNALSKLVWAFVFFVNCSLFFIYEKFSIPQRLWILGSRFRKIADTIRESDIVISISGESINDHFAPQMYMRGYLFYLCIKLGKDFYVFPQSIGPIFRNSSKKILNHFLSGAKAIFARDLESFKLSQEIWKGEAVEVVYCPDVAVTQDSVKNENMAIFHTGKKVVGITLSSVPSEISGGSDYFDKMVNTICKSLSPAEHCILMMPSNYKRSSISHDYEICLRASQFFQARGFHVDILNNQPIHPDLYQGIQKSLFLFISSRMHVGILATSASIPTIMLNTQHKIRGYMTNIGMEEFVMEYNEIESRLPALINLCTNKNPEIRSQLYNKNQEIRSIVMNTINNTIPA